MVTSDRWSLCEGSPYLEVVCITGMFRLRLVHWRNTYSSVNWRRDSQLLGETLVAVPKQRG